MILLTHGKTFSKAIVNQNGRLLAIAAVIRKNRNIIAKKNKTSCYANNVFCHVVSQLFFEYACIFVDSCLLDVNIALYRPNK